MTEAPAEELRRAAALMRDRAALVPPAPWYSGRYDVTTHDGLNVIASSGLAVRTQYVASWHPGVALAVADWLDAEADDRHAREFGPRSAQALVVARAYLGNAP